MCCGNTRTRTRTRTGAKEVADGPDDGRGVVQVTRCTPLGRWRSGVRACYDSLSEVMASTNERPPAEAQQPPLPLPTSSFRFSLALSRSRALSFSLLPRNPSFSSTPPLTTYCNCTALYGLYSPMNKLLRYIFPQDDECVNKLVYADTALLWSLSLATFTALAIAVAERRWPGCAGQ